MKKNSHLQILIETTLLNKLKVKTKEKENFSRRKWFLKVYYKKRQI